MSMIRVSLNIAALREETIKGNAAFREFYSAVIANCPNRRVAHLAKHAKKSRAREKNRKRAVLWAWTTWED